MLDATPYASFYLLPSDNAPLSDAISVRLDSYQFSIDTTTSVAADVVGKPEFDALRLVANQQENSAAVFAAIARPNQFAKAVLTQFDGSGGTVSAWALANVILVEQNTRNDGQATLEELNFTFKQITEATSQLTSSWNILTERAQGPTVPREISLSPYASVASSTELQLFTRSGDATPAVVLSLERFEFSVHNQLDGGAHDPITFDNLLVTAPMSSASPSLFKAVTSGTAFGMAKIMQRDGSGNLAAIWSMLSAFVVHEQLQGSDDSLPVLDLKFDYQTLSSATRTSVFQWDRATGKEIPGGDLVPGSSENNGKSNGPSSRDIVTGVTLELQGGTGMPFSLFVDSFAFGFHNRQTNQNGTPVNLASFDKMDARLALPGDAPRLLATLLTSKFYATATLTQRNSAGAINNVWVLGTVSLTDNQFLGSGAGETEQRLSFAFVSMSHATSTDTVAWNVATQRPDGPTLPVAPVAALPSADSNLLLNLYTSSNTPVVRIPINSFNFATRGASLLSTGTPSGETVFEPLEVTAVYQTFSPKLLSALTRAVGYTRATLTKQGLVEPITLVNFGVVLVADSLIEGKDGESPFQKISFTYRQITESASTVVRSWDVSTSRESGPTPQPGPDLAAMPVPASKVHLQLGGRPAPENVDLWVDSSDFGFAKTPTSIEFDAIRFTSPLSSMSPRLFGALTTASSFPTGRVTQFDAAGNIIADWQLKNLFITSDAVEGDQAATLQTVQITYQAFAQQVGSIQSRWDRVTNKSEFQLGANKSPNASREILNGLVLELSGGTAPQLTLSIDAFAVGYERQLANNVGVTLYKPLTVYSGVTEDTARLFEVMATGKVYQTARLLKYENSAFPAAGWQLSNVRVSADRSQASGGEAIKQIEFLYESLTLLSPTDVELLASAPSITYGQSTTLSATVFSNGEIVTRGSIQFALGGQILATVPVNATGRATLVLDSLTVAGSPYTIEALYLPVASYLPSASSVNISVAPATLLITPDNLQSKLYGAVMPPLTYQASGFVPGDSPQILTGTLGTTAQASSPVGTYPYLVTGLSAGANYTIQLNGSASFAIRPAPLTIFADDKTKVYGSENPTLTATISGLVNDDSASVVTGLVLSTTATLNSPPSTIPYPITASGATASNYEIEYIAGGLIITAIEVAASGVTFTPTAGAPFNGIVATFSVPGPAMSASSFIAQIAWGNGRTSPGIVTKSGNSFVVTGKSTFSTNGRFNVSVSIRHTSQLTIPAMVSSLAFATRLGFGQTQSVQYWSSSVGQSLIRSFNGNPTNTELANWLAATYPNVYGAQSGNQNLTGRSNAYVAGRFLSLAQQQRTLDQAVLATALNVYASTLMLGGTAGGKAGFQVTGAGLSSSSTNVGARGAAFGVADNTQLTVGQLLAHVNSQAINGTLYRATPALRSTAQQMFEQINVTGRSGVLADQVQSVEFWTSDRGVSLISALGGASSRKLSSWLATTYRNLYGASAGSHNLVGKTNSQVATYLQGLSSDSTTQTAAQVLTTALNLYASTFSLGGAVPSTFGFNVTEYGLGAAYFNIEQSGAVARVANQSTINVYALLQAIDRQSVNGNLFNGNTSVSDLCLELCRRLNTASNGI